MVQKLWQVLIMQYHTVHQSLYNFNAAAGNDLKYSHCWIALALTTQLHIFVHLLEKLYTIIIQFSFNYIAWNYNSRLKALYILR